MPTRANEETSGEPIGVENVFSWNVRSVREALEWSQSALAREMAHRGWPFHQQTINKIERHARPIRLGEAADLAEVLGMSLDAMLREENEVKLLHQVMREVKFVKGERTRLEMSRGAVEASERKLERLLAELDEVVPELSQQYREDVASDGTRGTDGTV